MLRRGLDFEKLSREYQKNKRIVISNFLQEEIAELIYAGFQEITFRNLWLKSQFGNPNFYDKNLEGFESIFRHYSFNFEKYPVKNVNLAEVFGETRIQDPEILKVLKEQQPEPNLPDYHPFMKFGEQINSNNMHDIISRITGHQLSKNSVYCFASRYTSGNFLGTHDDGNAPRIVAFTLNMTKHWLPHWGGNLTLFDNNYQNIIEAYMPKFNSLILFDVPICHTVLPVSPFCQSERLALTGWFHNFNTISKA